MAALRSLALLALISAASAAAAKHKVVFAVIGDWGWGPDGDYEPSDLVNQPEFGQFQRIVGAALGKKCQEVGCQFVLGTGDNFYGLGIDAQLGVFDPQWDSSWSEVYSAPSLKKTPFYHSLGNHDYGASYYSGSSLNRSHSIWPQVEYTYWDRSGQWNLPGRFYSVNPVPGNYLPVQVTVFDSSPHLVKRYCSKPDGFHYAGTDLRQGCLATERAAQLEWYQTQLQKARDNNAWSITIGHHPPRSTNQGPYIGYYEYITPILNETKPQMWFNGHDHTTAHLTNPDAPHTQFFWVGSSGVVQAGDGVLTTNPGDLDSPSLQTSAAWNASVGGKGYGWDHILSESGFAIVTLYPSSFTIQIWTADLVSNVNNPFRVTYQRTFPKM